MSYGFTQLEHLWTAAGGKPALAPVMAAIALAESSGGARPYGDYYAGQGATSFGLWQIHTRNENACLVNTQAELHPYDEHRLVVDAGYNARAAVAIERSQGLNAWSTYDHGHGAYRRFLHANTPPVRLRTHAHAGKAHAHHHAAPVDALEAPPLGIGLSMVGMLLVTAQVLARAYKPHVHRWASARRTAYVCG